jgi:transcription initiation factor IIE alpha subunit
VDTVLNTLEASGADVSEVSSEVRTKLARRIDKLKGEIEAIDKAEAG